MCTTYTDNVGRNLLIFDYNNCHRVKSVQIRSLPGPYFPAFGRDLRSKSPYSVQMRENTDQENLGE